MEPWIYFALASQFIFSFSSLVDKFILGKNIITNPYVYLAFNGFTHLLLVLLMPFVGLSRISFFGFLMALLSNAAMYAGWLVYYKAVQKEEISRITILLQFIPAIVLIMSYFLLDEKLTSFDYLGFALLLVAGIVVSYKRQDGKFHIGPAFYYILASSFLIAIAYISAKKIFDVTDFWNAVVWLKLTGFVALGVLASKNVRMEFKEAFNKLDIKIKSLIGGKLSFEFIAFILSDYAIFIGPVSLVSALASASSPLFVFFLVLLASAYIPSFVKEDMSKKAIIIKIASILLVTAGIMAISRG